MKTSERYKLESPGLWRSLTKFWSFILFSRKMKEMHLSSLIDCAYSDGRLDGFTEALQTDDAQSYGVQ